MGSQCVHRELNALPTLPPSSCATAVTPGMPRRGCIKQHAKLLKGPLFAFLAAVILLLPLATAHSFTDREELNDAKTNWLKNEAIVRILYGDIANWDVSRVTDMRWESKEDSC